MEYLSYLNKLVCPETNQPLLVRSDGYLVSTNQKTYLIQGNFIDFLVDSANFDQLTSAAASWRWKNSARIESDPGFATYQIQEFLMRYGFSSIDELKSFLQPFQIIAEIGAGEGRLADWYLQYSNALIICIEISESAYYLKEKYKDNSRVLVIRADATYSPLGKNSIDLLSTDQCIHHSPNPDKIFNALINSLKENGKVLFSVYAEKSPVRQKFDILIRDTVAQLPEEKRYEFSKQLTQIGKILSEIDLTIYIPEDWDIFGELQGQTMSLQRLLYYTVFKCFWNNQYSLEKNIELTFDWYSYPVCNTISLNQACDWFMKNQLEILHVHTNPSNINLIGRKK